MADERYAWLDQEAAERLLRGEPVDPLDDTARTQARLLADALDSARAPLAVPGPDGELPGEAAALAAFREAAAVRADRPHRAGRAAAEVADLGAVSLAPVRVAVGRRWGRSLRYGLAAAFAAAAVGGVAVAAGTGVLPLTSHPAPGRSVTAIDGTTPNESGSPSGGFGTEVPTAPSTGPGARTATPGGTGGPAATKDGPDGGATATPGTTAGGQGRSGEGTSDRDRALDACKAFRAGTLADSRRQWLSELLKNDDTVKRYCDRILSGASARPTATPSTGRTPSGNGKGSGNGNGGSGNGSGKGAENGRGSGSDRGDADDEKADRGKGRGRGQGNGQGDHGKSGERHGKDSDASSRS